MRKIIKNTLFIFIIFMWIFYFSDFFLLRGICVTKNKKTIEKYNHIKNPKFYSSYNNRNDSDFLTNYKSANLNNFSFFHNNFYINSQVNFTKYPELTNEENLFLCVFCCNPIWWWCGVVVWWHSFRWPSIAQLCVCHQ